VEYNNEKLEIVEQEDDAGLDNEDIQLSREQQLELKYKFKTFNAEVDSEKSTIQVGNGILKHSRIQKCLDSVQHKE
jgi:hypothetical protein